MNDVIVKAFPVFIPKDFVPLELCYRGKKFCPGQDASDGYKPRWGGGFHADRHGVEHHAIDIMGAIGAHILAVDDGKVEDVWVYKGERRPGAGYGTKGGFYCRVRHVWGVTYYAHMHQLPDVKPGDNIVAGQRLGLLGRTGNAAPGCPHLHISFTHRGKLIDPVPHLAPLYDQGGWHG